MSRKISALKFKADVIRLPRQEGRVNKKKKIRRVQVVRWD